MKALKFLLPLIVFLGITGLFYSTLDRNTRLVPSPLINKAAPEFSLPALSDAQSILSPATFKGKPWILNIWASWCRECRIEHPLFNQMAHQYDFEIVGLNYKDQLDDAKQWLQQFGDPFSTTIFDQQGTAGLDWGVYGVPETFLIDPNGIIRYKHVGPINPQIVQEVIVPFFAHYSVEKTPEDK